MFTDPIAQIIFTSPTPGKQWPFTAPHWPFLTGVTMAYEMARKATLQINLDAPYEDAIGKLLKRGTPLALGTNVQARIGYSSKPDWFTPWFGGFLNAGGDGLTLDANGLTGQISVQVIPTGAEYTLDKGHVVLDASPRVMLEQCIDAMHLLPALSPDALVAADIKGSFNDPDAFWRPEAYTGMTAWDAIKALCAFLNLKFWIGNDITRKSLKVNTIYVASDREITAGLIVPQTASRETIDLLNLFKFPRPTFRVRGGIDLSTGTFPCLGWAPEGGGASATWLAAGDDQAGKGVLLVYIDPNTGEIHEIPAVPEQQAVSTVGAQAAIQQDLKGKEVDGTESVADEKKQDGKPAVVVSVPMPSGDQGLFRAQTEANRRQLAGNPSQQGTISSIGLPWVTPPMLVDLAGAGDIYDGPYLVQKATHTWAGGSYEMQLTVLRQGGGGVDPEGEKKQTPAGKMPE